MYFSCIYLVYTVSIQCAFRCKICAIDDGTAKRCTLTWVAVPEILRASKFRGRCSAACRRSPPPKAMASTLGEPYTLASYSISDQRPKGKATAYEGLTLASHCSSSKNEDGLVTAAIQGDGVHVLNVSSFLLLVDVLLIFSS